MVTILHIEIKRSMACILLDTGEQYWIRAADLPGPFFCEGQQYDREAFLQNIRILQYPRALNHAVSMLARRPCSTHEIRTGLIRKQFSEDVSDLVVFKLEKEKLLDDRDFCEQWIRYRISRRYGPARIRHELKMKGINEDYIDEALEKTDAEINTENAVNLGRKYWNQLKPGDDIRKFRQKVISALVRKGYDWETAKAACEKAEREKQQKNCTD